MKMTDLHKNKGLKISNSIRPHGAVGKPGDGPAPLDKREQRKLDAARGLVPFACKLPLTLTNQLRDLAKAREVELNDLVEQLLVAGMQGNAAPAATAPQAEPEAVNPKAVKKAAR
jgi:hypothetical protein